MSRIMEINSFFVIRVAGNNGVDLCPRYGLSIWINFNLVVVCNDRRFWRLCTYLSNKSDTWTNGICNLMQYLVREQICPSYDQARLARFSLLIMHWSQLISLNLSFQKRLPLIVFVWSLLWLMQLAHGNLPPYYDYTMILKFESWNTWLAGACKTYLFTLKQFQEKWHQIDLNLLEFG